MNDDLERRLREVLRREAERITPNDRRTEILAMTHDRTQTGSRRRRWLIPAAAAATVALIGAAALSLSLSGSHQAAPPVNRPITSPTAPATPPAQVPVSPSPQTPDGSGSGATTQLTLPAYFVGASSAAGDRYGLYREFVRTAVPVSATPAQKAKAAVAVAMNAQPSTNEPYLQPWSATSVTDVTVTPALITVTLSGPGRSGLPAAQAKLAVQELVWTVQAAVGNGKIPVKFVVASGAPTLFGTYPTSQTYNRPPPDLQYEVLAPIWITSPVRDQVLPAGTAVIAAGESCAFEGTTQWQLKKAGSVVRSGVTNATSGCPTRGTWQVKLGALPAGSYLFRMYEGSMQNGKVIAETSRSFTVK